MSDPVASLVIGFKDWDLHRLDQCIRSALASFDDVPVEAIVSDYGSADGAAVAAVAAASGARYVRTDTDGTWSRARALNAGFAAAEADQFFATDADMIFSPDTLAAVSHRLAAHPGETIILQCRDLPPGTDTEDQDWLRYQQISTLRPRWGMGGLVATHRASFRRVRGYDERMHTYGREDMDFGTRLTRIGSPINWLDGPDIRMYHVWHPSSFIAASLDEVGEAAINANRRITSEDVTAIRNRTTPCDRLGWVGPIVSIVVNGADGAGDLASELESLLAQSVADIEILLVNPDASASATAEQLQDDRIRVVSTDRPWWQATSEARAPHLLLHAPGSWCPPTRLESLLDHTRAAHVMPADLTLVALRPSAGTALHPLPGRAGFPSVHAWASTLMPTRSALSVADLLGPTTQDPQDLLYCLLRHGVVIEPVDDSIRVELVAPGPQGELELDGATREARQLLARLGGAQLATDWLVRKVPQAAAERSLVEAQRYLAGEVQLVVWSTEQHELTLIREWIGDSAAPRTAWLEGESGEHVRGQIHVAGVSGALAHRLLQRGERSEGALRVAEVTEADAATCTDARQLLWRHLELDADGHAATPTVVISTPRSDLLEVAYEAASSVGAEAPVRRFVLHDDTAEREYVVTLALRAPEHPLAVVASTRAALTAECSVELWLPGSRGDLTLDDLVGEESP